MAWSSERTERTQRGGEDGGLWDENRNREQAAFLSAKDEPAQAALKEDPAWTRLQQACPAHPVGLSHPSPHARMCSRLTSSQWLFAKSTSQPHLRLPGSKGAQTRGATTVKRRSLRRSCRVLGSAPGAGRIQPSPCRLPAVSPTPWTSRRRGLPSPVLQSQRNHRKEGRLL